MHEDYETNSHYIGDGQDLGSNSTGENQTYHHVEHFQIQRRIQTGDVMRDAVIENANDHREEPEEKLTQLHHRTGCEKRLQQRRYQRPDTQVRRSSQQLLQQALPRGPQ